MIFYWLVTENSKKDTQQLKFWSTHCKYYKKQYTLDLDLAQL